MNFTLLFRLATIARLGTEKKDEAINLQDSFTNNPRLVGSGLSNETFHLEREETLQSLLRYDKKEQLQQDQRPEIEKRISCVTASKREALSSLTALTGLTIFLLFIFLLVFIVYAFQPAKEKMMGCLRRNPFLGQVDDVEREEQKRGFGLILSRY